MISMLNMEERLHHLTAVLLLSASLLLSSLAATATAEEEGVKEGGEQKQEEEEEAGYLSTTDYVLLALMGVGAVWYFFFRSKKEEVVAPTYVIQPAMPIAPTSANKGFVEKMRSSKRRLVVFYGSQTGTAEEFAGRLAKEGARYGIKGVVADPEESEMEDICQVAALGDELDGPTLAVFMMATYGEGDPTDNCQDFIDWLKAGGVSLKGLNYAVFGLGNKTYEHYNAVAVYVDERLEALGGQRRHPLGLGDDDANIEDDFITWKEAFWIGLRKTFNLEITGDDFNTRQYEAKVLGEGDYKPERLYTGEPARFRSLETQRPPFDPKNPFLAPIRVNRALHNAGSDRHCMHIELDVSESRIRYDAGDHVAVYPQNDPELVNRLASLLNIDLDTVFTMTNLDEDSTKKHPFPCPTTYRTALTYYVDITALPRTHIMKELAAYTSDPTEKEKLLLMCSTSDEGKRTYASWVQDATRHMTHVLEDLPGVRPPIDHVMELLPRLQPRFYSISSSSRQYPNSIHITGVVVEYQTSTGRTNKGVATTWLQPMVPTTAPDAAAEEGNKDAEYKVPVFVRRSQFRLPNRPQTPVIMVGPGTGLAPFRGFIQERAWQKAQGKPMGETHLFFGCRNEAIDFIYRDEMEAFAADGLLTLHTAFSRDQAHKIYVSHRLKENADTVWKLIGEQNGHFYVCGDAGKMAKEVHAIVVEIVVEKGGKTQEEAEAYVKKMESQKRYSADVWS